MTQPRILKEMNTKVGTKERSASEGEDSTMSVQSPEHVEVLDLCAKQTEPREAQEAGIESEDYGNGRLHYQERVASGQMCSTSGQSSEYLCFFLHRLLAFRYIMLSDHEDIIRGNCDWKRS